MYQPEQLNLWDRLFNRYRKEVAERGKSEWSRVYSDAYGYPIESTRRPWVRNYVDYHIIDRLTGGYTIKREYLN